MLIFVISILWSMTSAFALDAKVMADKISTLLESNCMGNLPSSTSSADIVFLRGSPFDAGNAPQAGQKLVDISSLLAEKRGHQILSEAIHHSQWRSACDRLAQSSSERIYLVGHSYGAAGVVKIANCLKEKNKEISLLATISSYDFLSGVDVTKIPANVESHFNYHTTDPSIPGYDNHKAEDPNQTFVRNILAKQESSFPHLNVAEDIVALITLQIFADVEGKLEQILIPETFNANTSDENINQFWQCGLHSAAHFRIKCIPQTIAQKIKG